MADWNVIKAEYVANPKASYRSLAETYNVPLRSLARVAAEEKWPELRQQASNEVTTAIVKKNQEAMARRYKNFTGAVDKLLRKIIKSVNAVDQNDTLALFRLSASLKNMQDICGISLDEKNRTEITVSFSGDLSGLSE